MSTRASSRQSTRSITKKGKEKQRQEQEDQQIEELKNSEYTNEQLYSMKAQAIEEMDFDRSRIIQSAIDKRFTDNSADVINQGKKWIQQELTNALDEDETICVNAQDQQLDRETKIREQIEKEFQNMKERHLKQQTDLEVEKNLKIMVEKERESKQVRDYLNKAKIAARANEFDTAKQLKAQAEETKQTQQEEAMKQIKQLYEGKIKRLTEAQGRELDGLTNKLNDLLAASNAKMDKELQDQKTKLTVFIRHILSVATTEGAKRIQNKSKRSQLNTEFTNYITELLRKKGRSELFDSTRQNMQ